MMRNIYKLLIGSLFLMVGCGDDDSSPVLLSSENGKFIEKYKYQMTVEAGVHDYLIRCSADYYWYSGEINAVKIEKEEPLHNLKLQILCGD